MKNKNTLPDINLAEIKCSKSKNIEKCHTSKCLTYNRYSYQSLPCPYYIPSDKERGFSGELNEIKGTQIRRMYFNVWIYGMLLNLVLIIVIEALLQKNILSAFQLAIECVIYMFMIIIPIAILSLLNKCFFGRVVCVVDEIKKVGSISDFTI